MKKTSIFNLGGNACYIDDDAAEVLRNYLDELRRHFGDNPSTDEVMNDIEMRLWEIFNEHKRYGMQVVSMREVEEAMAILGKVDDFGTIEGNTTENENKATEASAQPDEPANGSGSQEYSEKDFIRKRLFRNPDDKVIGGVASGLAAYLDIQSVWARILFVLFFLFSGGIVLIIYLVLWIVIPQARTTAQRLEMQGIRPTAENIRQYVSQSIESGNLPEQNGNGCLQASAIGCGILIFLPVICSSATHSAHEPAVCMERIRRAVPLRARHAPPRTYFPAGESQRLGIYADAQRTVARTSARRHFPVYQPSVAARAGNPPHRENRSPGGMAGCPRVDNRENRMARGITSAKYPS